MSRWHRFLSSLGLAAHPQWDLRKSRRRPRPTLSMEPLEPRYALSGLAGSVVSVINSNTYALPGVLISVVGRDAQNNVIASASVRTAADGTYSFTGLPAGTYTITESQPGGISNGSSVAGSLGGSANTDVISNIVLGEGVNGTGYNFREGAAVISVNLFLASTPPTHTLLANTAAASGPTTPAVAFATVTDPINSANVANVSVSGTGKPGSSVSVVITEGTATTTARTGTVVANGAWTVSGMNANQLANGRVTYRATLTDGTGATATSTRTATKSTSNTPVAEDDTYSLAIGATLTTTTTNGVLANDAGGGLTATLITPPARGSFTLNPNGTFTYTQTTYGYDEFVYEATNSTGQKSQATVKIQVPGLPRLPVGAVLTTTASGLQYYDFQVGTGASPSATATVTVDYVGYLPNGNVFDRNNNINFALNNLIEGFSEGVQGMKVGDRRRLIIPPDIGYGSSGNPNAGIGGTDTIVFEVILDAIL